MPEPVLLVSTSFYWQIDVRDLLRKRILIEKETTYKDNGRHSSMIDKNTPRNVRMMNQCNSIPDFRK
jgi:hypothetical protein